MVTLAFNELILILIFFNIHSQLFLTPVLSFPFSTLNYLKVSPETLTTQKLSFPLSISSVKVAKSSGNLLNKSLIENFIFRAVSVIIRIDPQARRCIFDPLYSSFYHIIIRQYLLRQKMSFWQGYEGKTQIYISNKQWKVPRLKFPWKGNFLQE